MIKYTKNDYFAAVSAFDFWDRNPSDTTFDVALFKVCLQFGVDVDLFLDIFEVTYRLVEYQGEAFPSELVVQIGCELAGL